MFDSHTRLILMHFIHQVSNKGISFDGYWKISIDLLTLLRRECFRSTTGQIFVSPYRNKYVLFARFETHNCMGDKNQYKTISNSVDELILFLFSKPIWFCWIQDTCKWLLCQKTIGIIFDYYFLLVHKLNANKAIEKPCTAGGCV